MENIKSSYNNNKFKISAPTWNDEFELPDGLYSVSDIEDYFEYILKKQGENTDKTSVEIYVNKIKNRVTFKNKNGYSLELLASETMKLLGSTENKIAKDKNGEKYHILKLQKLYWFIAILLIMIISKIQENYVHLFPINRLVAY